MTRAFYVRGTNSGERPDLVLWDTINHQELWHIEYYSVPYLQTFGLLPGSWSRDSAVIAFAYKGETGQLGVYVLDRDGVLLQAVRPDMSLRYAVGMSWSPDGRYLAYAFSLAQDPLQRGIVIYDYAENTVTEMCPLNERDVPLQHMESPGMVWSPDGQYLVYGVGPDDAVEESKLVMLNIYTGEVRLITRGTSYYWLVGWSPVSPWVAP
jgi:Tol biopolymer transport system component